MHKERTFYSPLVFFFLKSAASHFAQQADSADRSADNSWKSCLQLGWEVFRNGFFGQFFAMFAITSHNTGIPQLVLFFGPQATALFEKPH